jgi:hypothetical protein
MTEDGERRTEGGIQQGPDGGMSAPLPQAWFPLKKVEARIAQGYMESMANRVIAGAVKK